jgi:hypothetical protein
VTWRRLRHLRHLRHPRALARRLLLGARTRAARAAERARDKVVSTFAVESPGGLARLLPDPRGLDGSAEVAAALRSFAPRWLEHRFDLLGSGWVCVATDGPGLERLPRPALEEARRRWALVGPDHAPLDWQLDFKSGHRWDERTWFRDVRYGHLPGVDVKVPWELGRLQHLPRLALAHALARAGHEVGAPPERLAREVVDVAIDFVARNPPRFGVGWACTMDVAIRAANVAVAVDLLRAGGGEVPGPALAVLATALLEHGRHVAAHLEWDPVTRANHYLADLAGLAIVAAYLPSSSETDGWLAFAQDELQDEVELQFSADGSNFEASTCYHRLSAEMVAWSASILLALPDERWARVRAATPATPPGPPPRPRAVLDDRLRPGVVARLAGMARFARLATRPDGRVAQVGDNDGGRFVTLEPLLEAGPDPREELLDLRPLASTLEGLLGLPAGGPGALEGELLRRLAGPRALPPPERAQGPAYSLHFGLFVLRASRLWVAVRCGPVGQRGNGGHDHHDALSLEVAVDGVSLVVDPGTGVYTPDPALRDRLRASRAHATLAVDGLEQNGPRGLFALEPRADPRALVVEADRFVGEHVGYGAPHRREVVLEAGVLRVSDSCAAGAVRRVRLPLAPGVEAVVGAGGVDLAVVGVVRARVEGAPGAWRVERARYSPTYGRLEDALVLELETQADVVAWRLEARP